MNNFSLKAMPFDSEVITNPKTGQEEYDRVAHSKDLADLVRAYFSNGILVQGSDMLTNELQVLHLSAMSCVVKPGGIIINGRTGFLENEQTIEFDVGTQNPRIDRVVAELNIAERNIYIRVLKGTATADPKPVDIMQTEDIYQIPLAQVRINANQSVIASVTDERGGYISNVLLNQAPRTDVQAAEIKISEVVRNLYGLTADNGNVEKAFEKVKNTFINQVGMTVKSITSSQNWISPITGTIYVFLCGGGGAGGSGRGSDGYSAKSGGGGGGFCVTFKKSVIKGQVISAVIGAGGNTGASSGGDTIFGNLLVKGGDGGSNGSRWDDGKGGDGASGGGLGSPGAEKGASASGKGFGGCYCFLNDTWYAKGGDCLGIQVHGGNNTGNGGSGATPNYGSFKLSDFGTGGSGIIVIGYWQ